MSAYDESDFVVCEDACEHALAVGMPEYAGMSEHPTGCGNCHHYLDADCKRLEAEPPPGWQPEELELDHRDEVDMPFVLLERDPLDTIDEAFARDVANLGQRDMRELITWDKQGDEARSLVRAMALILGGPIQAGSIWLALATRLEKRYRSGHTTLRSELKARGVCAADIRHEVLVAMLNQLGKAPVSGVLSRPTGTAGPVLSWEQLPEAAMSGAALVQLADNPTGFAKRWVAIVKGVVYDTEDLSNWHAKDGTGIWCTEPLDVAGPLKPPPVTPPTIPSPTGRLGGRTARAHAHLGVDVSAAGRTTLTMSDGRVVEVTGYTEQMMKDLLASVRPTEDNVSIGLVEDGAEICRSPRPRQGPAMDKHGNPISYTLTHHTATYNVGEPGGVDRSVLSTLLRKREEAKYGPLR